MSQTASRILAIDPSRRGFGSALFELPFRLVEGRFHHVYGDKNRASLAQFEILLTHLQPERVILEDTAAKGSRRRPRIVELLDSMAALSRERGVPVERIARLTMLQAFAPEGVTATKEEVAARLAQFFPELQGRLPRHRETWDGEDERLAIFDALALAVAATMPTTKGARSAS